MTHPTSDPPTSHTQGSPPPVDHYPPLPAGFTTGWSETYKLPFYVDTRGPYPVSSWIHPYAPGEALGSTPPVGAHVEDHHRAPEHAQQEDHLDWKEGGGVAAAAASIAALADHEWEKRKREESFEEGRKKALEDEHDEKLQYELEQLRAENENLRRSAAGPSGGRGSPPLPPHGPAPPGPHEPHHYFYGEPHHWVEDAGAALAGAGVGAFAEHEWEKHKQEAAYEEGRRKGQEEQRRRDAAVQAELQKLRHENELIRRGRWSTKEGQYDQGYEGHPRGGSHERREDGYGAKDPRYLWSTGGTFEGGDGRMGPYA